MFHRPLLFLSIPKIEVILNRQKKQMTDVVEVPVGYKKIKESCTLPEKIVSKKSNEIWLIRAPEDVCDFD